MIRVLPCLILIALGPAAMGQIGPDVISGAFYTQPHDWGSSGNVAAFSLGARACNIGDQPVPWVANTADHPVIGQNIYRVRDGVFEQIGVGWLKHGYSAIQQTFSSCGTCQPNPNNQALGPGCSDPYAASLNGAQSLLGPRSDVNPVTGAFPYPPTSPPIVDPVLDRRIQVHHDDIDPAMNLGATYFGEMHYVSAADSLAGNQNNNASHKELTVAWNGAMYDFSDPGGPDFPQLAAIYGWQSVHPSVTITPVDIPGDGRFLVGHHAISLGGGFTRHVYAVHNLNSDRACSSLTVTAPSGALIQNPTFHDIHHHSGEPWQGDDWNTDISGNVITWSVTDRYSLNPNANAIRWGTCYTFTFESDQPTATFSLGLFKPACPATASAQLTLFGDGSPNTFVGVELAAIPGRPLIVGLDSDPGPTSLGPLGSVALGFSPAFFTLADQTGTFGTPTGNDFTNACGYWSFWVDNGPGGLPSLTAHVQAIVIDGAAPNGVFFISNPVTLVVP